jgi:hypothetical protein
VTQREASDGRLLDPVVRNEIASASVNRQRRIAAEVAAYALSSLPNRPPELDAAVAELMSGRRDPATRRIVAGVAERLDQLYLEMHDDEKPGGRTAGWEPAFSVARAAAAVAFAFEDDPRVAAFESTYEAIHAVDGDEAAIKSVVLETT